MKAAWASNKLLESKNPQKVVILCGSGNNGGDGYGLAATLVMSRIDVEIVSFASPTTCEAIKARDFCMNLGVSMDNWNGVLPKSDWYVDALFGLGISRPIEGEVLSAVRLLNSRSASDSKVLALDVPTGVNACTGEILSYCVRADYTLCFLSMKQGLLTGDAVDFVGELLFDNLGLPDLREGDSFLLKESDCHANLSSLKAHKGIKGNILLLGGMIGMEGAAVIAGKAALKAGAGKLFWMSNTKGLQRPPELILSKPDIAALDELIGSIRVCIVGPGLGSEYDFLVEKIWNSNVPLVLDADGLRWLARAKPKIREAPFIGTPHPGEAKAILGWEIKNRFFALKELKNKYSGSWILKGAGTLISENNKVFLNNLANPRVGTAGMGDLLSGLIGGLWSNHSNAPSRSAVWIHSRAALSAIKQNAGGNLLASELFPHIGKELESIASF